MDTLATKKTYSALIDLQGRTHSQKVDMLNYLKADWLLPVCYVYATWYANLSITVLFVYTSIFFQNILFQY